jgi:hypothetical protein
MPYMNYKFPSNSNYVYKKLIINMNTIQLISFIQHLNVNLPFEIRKQQASTNKYIKQMNILSYIKRQGKDLKESITLFYNDENSFISETVYQFVILNLILYSISKYCTGKLQEVGNNMLKNV